ncbi:MAG: NUDIX hydrolase [Lachnospiraceae bacterium]|nr:NUDIX hydrolase [Lachnospiraceae bacterium]
MSNYNMSAEEKKFLKQYDITQFERPSVATDIAIFSILREGEIENFRKLPKKSLKLLLIKRANYPYKDCWALPGGFCRPNEDIYETAKRELFEETNVKNAYLQLSGIFGEIGRDPRGWIISNTFLALIDGEQCQLRAGTDAWEAKWFSVDLEKNEKKNESSEESATMETEYTVTLCCESDNISLSVRVMEYKEFRNYHETVRYEILDSVGLAFDHVKIILQTLLSLRKQVENEATIVFDLMPELFTLTQLQNAFELILQEKLLTANFRRKIADYVIETEQIIEGAGHRPAKLFKRNVKAFYK